MPSTSNATHADTRMLSILRPGEMLRFVLAPDRERKIDFGLEGCSTDEAGSALFAERLSLVLGELRTNGYAFGGRLKELPSVRKRKRTRTAQRSRAWVEILPVSLPGIPARLDSLGFAAAKQGDTPAQPLRLPDLPASRGGCTLESPATLVAAIPEIELFEVEFIRADITEETVRVLEEALRLQLLTRQAAVPVDQPTLSQVFLASWLWHRTGWKVTARARLRGGCAAPVAPLEMIGRDLFACECEVISSRDSAEAHAAFDFRNADPRGWQFPPILPPPAAFDTIKATRLHNISLPELPTKGLRIGVAEGVDIRMPAETRDRHTYIVGATGTGKSVLMTRMIREDMKRGEGLILLDPHGDLYQAVKDSVPKNRRKDLFLLDPCDGNELPGLNILDIPSSPFRRRHAAFLVGELFRFFAEIWDMRQAGGPVFEMYFRNVLLLMCLQEIECSERNVGKPDGVRFECSPRGQVLAALVRDGRTKPGGQHANPSSGIEYPLSFADFMKVMANAEFRKALLARCSEKSVVQFWTEVAEKTSGDYRLANFVPYVACKINGLVQTGFVADMLCSRRNDIRIGERMDRGEIILVNLNKGLLGAYESRLLGTILMMEIFAASLSRSARPEAERRPVNVYVDEFQNFVSDNVAAMLSEARKFGLRLTLANQTLAQLKANSGRQDLLETVLGNVGNMILFRLGVPDAERLRSFIEPFSQQEMQELPNYHALVRLLTGQGPVRPLIMRTLAA